MINTVPFHEAKVARGLVRKDLVGEVTDLPGDRQVRVRPTAYGAGFCINIKSPTTDGKTSELMFALRTDAALALCRMLPQAQGNVLGRTRVASHINLLITSDMEIP